MIFYFVKKNNTVWLERQNKIALQKNNTKRYDLKRGDTKMNMNVGDRIRKARKGKMTQAELANLIGVHEITVRRWELGERSPDVNDLQKISNVLDIPASELLGEDAAVDNPVEKISSVLPLSKVKKSPSSDTGYTLVYERNGERMELPPTEESYAIFRDLAATMARRDVATA